MGSWQVRIHILRGVAAWCVVAFHTTFWLPDGSLETTSPWLKHVFPGIPAVFVFFVLSGYVTTRAHGGDFNRPEALWPFLWRRLARLYPAYWLFSLAALALGMLGFYSWDMQAIGWQTLGLRVQAWSLMPFDGMPLHSNLAVGWTLFHEMLFYGCVALAIVRRWAGVAVGALLVCYSYWGLPGFTVRPPLFQYVNVMFVPGVLLALVLPRVKVPLWCGRACWMAGLVFFYVAVFRHLEFKLFVLACTLLVGGLAALDLHHPAPRATVLVRLLSGLGTISYSLYLCHVPVQSLVYARVGAPDAGWKWWLYVLAPLPVAWLGYWLVEKPAADWVRRAVKP